MRNDARPVGEDGHDESPLAEDQSGDQRDSVAHDRQSHVINKGAADNARRSDREDDPVMPADDATRKTRI